MKTKKYPAKNLERKRPTFFLIGLSLSIGLLLMAFEWTNHSYIEQDLYHQWGAPIDEEIPPVTREQMVTPPQPRPPVVEFQIIDEDDDDIPIDDIDLFNTEITDNTPVFEPIIMSNEEDDTPIDFVIVEEKPEFVGGEAAFYKFLNKNIKYPEIALQNNAQGKVYIRFTIDKDGSIIDAHVARPLDKYLEAEALRIFEIMPKWKPGKQRGKTVKVSYIIPINFVLSDN
ncbi:MAG: energy transducer TonB [Bacteroidales bacterium]|nr:energy transducer TonB [Bacteroidales bacterium]